MGQRYLGQHVATQVGQQPQLHQYLKAVADAEHKFSVGDKLLDIIEQRAAVGTVLTVAQLISQHHARAEVIAEGEAAGEIQNVEIVDAYLPVQYLVEVHNGGFGPGQAVGGRKFFFAVDAKSGQNQRPHGSRRHYASGLCLQLNFMCSLSRVLYHFKSLLGQWEKVLCF